MNHAFRITVALAALALSAPALAQVVFYEHDGFEGRSFTTTRQVNNLTRYGFNDRASSAVVIDDQWEVCQDDRFRGRCMVLRPGRYASLGAMGLGDRISSARSVGRQTRYSESRYAPWPEPVYDNRRRGRERLYQADVVSVRAVVGPPERRCWIEREQLGGERRGANVPGAVVGAIVGGVLGHQVGGGRGKDLATAGGAVAGAVIGSNVGRDRDGREGYSRDVEHCANAPGSARPAYWDVVYTFRGQEHRVQMAYQPGNSVTVNRYGEPRA